MAIEAQRAGLPDTSMQAVALRDRQMAENLLAYLADNPDDRVLVWGATFHGVRDPESIDPGAAPVDYHGLCTLGCHLHSALGEAIYVVGFTAHQGRYGMVGQPAVTIKASSIGSLEELFATSGFGEAFLDLRTRTTGGGWLEDDQRRARFLSYVEMTSNWTTQLDGIVFTRTMERAYAAPRAPRLTEPLQR